MLRSAAAFFEQYPGIVESNGWQNAYYDEDLLMGYRWYDMQVGEWVTILLVGLPEICLACLRKQDLAPLFPFGHGLSYTVFSYDPITITPLGNVTWLVSSGVTNTGLVAGAEVVQVRLDSLGCNASPVLQW